MKIKNFTCSAIYIILTFLIFTYTAKAQDNPPRLSSKASVSQTVGYTDVTVDYGRPGVKGRVIWGGLVPYDEVWRTGANEATAISFSTDVKLNGNLIPAGRYSLFTIPTEGDWTVILNKVDNQWGAFKYDQNEDLIRFKVTPVKSNFVEWMSFRFDNMKPYSADLAFEWENLSFLLNINTKKD